MSRCFAKMRLGFALSLTCLAGCEWLVGVDSKSDLSPPDDASGGSAVGASGSGGVAGMSSGGNGSSSGRGGSGGKDGSGGTSDASSAGATGGAGGVGATGGAGGVGATGGTSGVGATGGTSGAGGTSGVGATGGTSGVGASGGADDGPPDAPPPLGECPREFDVSAYGGDPTWITVGSDGNVWFSKYPARRLTRITPSGDVTDLGPTELYPWDIAAGPDGALWYASVYVLMPSRGAIGRMTTGGQLKEYALDGLPNQVSRGPDGNVWFTYSDSKRVGKITPVGEVTNYDMPASAGPYGEPGVITTGPDGNLWFTVQHTGSDIGVDDHVVRMTTGGEMTVFQLPRTNPTNNPGVIVAGPDGALWFAEGARGVGRITTDGDYSEFPAGRTGLYVSVAFARDGQLWITDFEGNRIGRMSRSGVYVWIPLPHIDSKPNDIVLGPDGNLWFTERHPYQSSGQGNRIGRMHPACGN